MPKKAAGENSKKAAGNAKKAEAAASKQAEKDRQAEAAEAADWDRGANKKAANKAADKAAVAEEKARKAAEKKALEAAEDAAAPSKPKGAGAKTAQKKTRGIDAAFSDLDSAPASKKGVTLNATGIDNALDALSLTSNTNESIDRHPERRFPAAYKAFEERRLEEMKDEKGLRRQQKIDQIRKEFDKHPDNPFNQVNASYNTTRQELRDMASAEKAKTEARLTQK